LIEALAVANITAVQPVCPNLLAGSITLDLPNGASSVEYAIVSGNTFTGTPTFTTAGSSPFSITSGTGTVASIAGMTYTIRVRYVNNTNYYQDYTYTLSAPSNPLVYVNAAATGSNNGTSWANAFTNIHDALNAACDGSEIWVASGIYLPTQDCFGNPNPADPRDKTFYLKDGVKMYGSFAGTETQLSQRQFQLNPTLLRNVK
jgi:hypothetical protein